MMIFTENKESDIIYYIFYIDTYKNLTEVYECCPYAKCVFFWKSFYYLFAYEVEVYTTVKKETNGPQGEVIDKRD